MRDSTNRFQCSEKPAAPIAKLGSQFSRADKDTTLSAEQTSFSRPTILLSTIPQNNERVALPTLTPASSFFSEVNLSAKFLAWSFKSSTIASRRPVIARVVQWCSRAFVKGVSSFATSTFIVRTFSPASPNDATLALRLLISIRASHISRQNRTATSTKLVMVCSSKLLLYKSHFEDATRSRSKSHSVTCTFTISLHPSL